jgi:hypothetical protein
MLSNIFLHHVLDKWFEDVVRPRMRGKATLVRRAPLAFLKEVAQDESYSLNTARRPAARSRVTTTHAGPPLTPCWPARSGSRGDA